MPRRLAFISGLVIAAVGVALVLLPGTWDAGVRAQSPSIKPSTAAASAVGEDTIWSAVVIARNAKSPKPLPPELKGFATRLNRVFGYNQFDLVGTASDVIENRREVWLVPSQNFWMSVKARRSVSKEARGGYLLSLQLFQDERPLVDTEAKLAPGSPLFIRGPMHANGQLIIVLQVESGAAVIAGH